MPSANIIYCQFQLTEQGFLVINQGRMGEPWVKVFLKNGQFETANQNKKKSEDHVYQYLMSKYRSLFDVLQSPKRKPIKPQAKPRRRSNSFNNPSFEIKTPLSEQKSCQRCVKKYPSEILTKKVPTPRRKRPEHSLPSKKKLKQGVENNPMSEMKLNLSLSTRPVSLSTFNKRAGFIRKGIDTPVQDLISSSRKGLRI